MVKGVEKQILLTAIYETVFGIFNHQDKNINRPLSSVAMHEAEDVNNNDALRASLLSFTRNDIKDLWNLNYLQYVALPSFIVKELNETAAIAKKEKAKALNDIMNNSQE